MRAWAAKEAPRHPGLLRLGWFGSYARGDAGVGSDLDLIAVVAGSSEPFERRSLAWDLLPLPVPAEILIYTSAEWEQMKKQGGRFVRTIEREASWLTLPEDADGGPIFQPHRPNGPAEPSPGLRPKANALG